MLDPGPELAVLPIGAVEANGEPGMIKDIVVNLPVGKSADVAASFAVSLAAKFGAHLTGIAFRYEPVIPAMVDMYGVSPEIIESQREENEKTAKAAVARFGVTIK